MALRPTPAPSEGALKDAGTGAAAPGAYDSDAGRRELRDGLANAESKPEGGAGKLREELSRNFVLRAESPEAAARRVVRIAGSMGGWELGTVPDTAGLADKAKEAARGGEADLGYRVKTGPAPAPEKPVLARSPAPPSKPQPAATKTASGTEPLGAGAAPAPAGGGAMAAAPERSSIMLVIPVNRLETFKQALANWSAAGRQDALDKTITEGKKPAENLKAGALDERGAGEVSLRCALAGSVTLDLDEETAKAANEPGLAGRKGKVVLVVITVTPERP
jgi:hypothetical protein